MDFWDIAGKIGGAALKAGKIVADGVGKEIAKEHERMKDPRYRAAKKELWQARAALHEAEQANREIDSIIEHTKF